MISACRNMMKHVAESIKTLDGQLKRSDEVWESDQLRHAVIGFSGIMQVLVWFKTRTGTCIPLTPALFVLKISKNSIMRQTTRKSLTETSIETGVVQAIETLLRRVMYVNHLSSYLRYHTHCIILAPLRTHYRRQRCGEQYLMQVLCRWDVVLYLGYRVFEVVGWYIDVGDWMLFRMLIDDLQCDFFGRISWRCPEILVYRLSSHSTYETHTSISQ